MTSLKNGQIRQEINPGDYAAYHTRAIAYYHKGNYDNSISDYTKTIEINPKFSKAYLERAVLYLLKKASGGINRFTYP